MTTQSYQYTIFEKIKFGFSMLFRCINCFHNVFEKIYFMAFAQQSCPNTVPFIYCPYCGDKVYALEEQPGGYNLLFTVDQSILVTLTIQMQGINLADYTIVWGDNTLSSGSFNGTLQSFTHDYSIIGDYNIKIFVDDAYLLFIDLKEENLKGNMPGFKQFANITEISLNVNSLSGTIPDLDNLLLLTVLKLQKNNFSGSAPSVANNTALMWLFLQQNSLTGIPPSISTLTSLERFIVDNNQFSGSLPDISSNTALKRVSFHTCFFSGSIPAFGSNTNLEWYLCYDNAITGTIPSLSNLAVFIRFSIYTNQIAGYTASTIALTLDNFLAYNNLLTQVAVDQILSDFNDNLASRPGSGIINLGGTGNATPSAAGLVHKANIIAHGWTVTTN